MKAFDNNTITTTMYTATAVKIKDNTLQYSTKEDYGSAYVPFEYLLYIACKSLISSLPTIKASSVIASNPFNLRVKVAPIDKYLGKKRDRRNKSDLFSRFSLTPTNYSGKLLLENCIGLPEEWFKKEEVSNFEKILMIVDPIESLRLREHITMNNFFSNFDDSGFGRDLPR